MKKLQSIKFFQHEGLYVIEDEFDSEKKSTVYLISELSNKIQSIHHIDKIENDIVTLDDGDIQVRRSEIIRILGLANIPTKFKDIFVDGKIVETGEGYTVSKSSKYIGKGDLCNINDHFVLCELLSDEIRLREDEWSWDDSFEAKIIYVNELEEHYLKEKGYKVDDIVRVARRNLSNTPSIHINLKCECCGHEIQ